MLKFKTSCAVLTNLSSNLLNEVGLSLFRYFEVGLRVCDIVVNKYVRYLISWWVLVVCWWLDQTSLFRGTQSNDHLDLRQCLLPVKFVKKSVSNDWLLQVLCKQKRNFQLTSLPIPLPLVTCILETFVISSIHTISPVRAWSSRSSITLLK